MLVCQYECGVLSKELQSQGYEEFEISSFK